MRYAVITAFLCCGISLTVLPLLAQDDSIAEQNDLDLGAIERFERDVRPLLLENCASCHSKSVGKVMGGLSLDSRQEMMKGGESGPAFNVESPKDSLLLEAVRRESFEMPPDKHLDSRQVTVLEQWFSEGAVWPEHPAQSSEPSDWVAQRAKSHWAWQPIQNPPVPNAGNWNGHSETGWPLGPVDSFILQKLRQNDLTPTGRATSHELLRRLTFDLVGLPPTVLQQDLFAIDYAADPQIATQRMVDALLASPQFGVQWGRHWLDLMRYAETLGHEFDYPIHHAWRYRDAVVDAFNDDLDYRRLIDDHLAGDLNEHPRIHPITGVDQSLALTGWWWLGDAVHAPVDVKSDLATRIENQVDVLSKSFLGMTIACARCHDHKFDAISMKDYYGLVAVASSTRRRYAITDPYGRIADHLSVFRDHVTSANQAARSGWHNVSIESVERWLEAVLEAWNALSGNELDQQVPISSPLYPLRLLLDKPSEISSTDASGDSDSEATDAAFAARIVEFRKQFSERSEQYVRWASESPLFADFRQGLPSGWTLEAIEKQAWAKSVSDSKEFEVDWWNSNFPAPVHPGTFFSSRNGRHQLLTLRSPDFEITKPIICLKMHGKSTQSSVIVSNYFMDEFHGLLFGDLRKPIDQPDEFGWVTHAGDLRKYQGHSAFLSLENEAEAWFELAEVRFSDSQPPLQPHEWAVELLNVDAPSKNAFKIQVVKRLFDTITEWRNNSTYPGASVVRSMIRFLPHELLSPEIASMILAHAQRVKSLDRQSPEPTRILAIEEGTAKDVAIHLRGNPHRLGEKVSRECLCWLPSWKPTEQSSSGRQELALSLTSSEHPLVARVMVNRIWHHLIGEGLVASNDNFGVLGSRPSHPELLDWLSSQFMEHDWSIKWLVRQIVTSQTYALGNQATTESRTGDPNGRLLSFRPVRRLTAENLRDAVLSNCGELDLQMGGPSVPVHLTDQMTGRGRPMQSGPLDGDRRRSLYVEVRRNFLSPFLLVFDFPMPSTTAGRRNRSNLPAQALSLLNDPFMIEMSRRWEKSTAEEKNTEKRIGRMIQAAFSRPATPEELNACAQIIDTSDETSWTRLAHVLLNAKAFTYLK